MKPFMKCKDLTIEWKKSYFYWKQKNWREVLMLLCLYALKNFLKNTNFLMAGAVELPAYVIACLGMDKIGRRNTLIPFLIMSAVICGIVMLIPQVSDSYRDRIGSYRNTFDVFNLQCFIRFPILSQNSPLPSVPWSELTFLCQCNVPLNMFTGALKNEIAKSCKSS